MIGKNYLAALGTIFIFLGGTLIKAARPTTRILKEGEVKIEKPKKFWLIFGGIVCFLLGIALIAKSIINIYN